MKCPGCGHLENKVIDSRLSSSGETTRRRRECEQCGRRYTTYERVEEALPLIVKNDGRREPYDRAKLMKGVENACHKRPVPRAQLDALADEVERDLQELGEREVSSNVLGEKVMARLRTLDQVAYVRFASVYRKFEDLDDYKDVIQHLKREERHS